MPGRSNLNSLPPQMQGRTCRYWIKGGRLGGKDREKERDFVKWLIYGPENLERRMVREMVRSRIRKTVIITGESPRLESTISGASSSIGIYSRDYFL